ncbi:eukaryotic rRNA processing protein EBP2-domain-containing protein [Xylariaceae sp. FL1651]|nr:eukaryotic rRNA processing protein EBP2-domain-containing protein [Xylariaceae sp. FL1651]
MGRSKLKTALKAEKGIDIKKLKEKRRLKQRAQSKAKRVGKHGGAVKASEDDDGDEEEDEDIEGGALVAVDESGNGDDDNDEDEDEVDGAEAAIDLAALDESSDDSSVDFEEKIVLPKKAKQTHTTAPTPKTTKKDAEVEDDEEEDEDEEDEDDEEIDWADLPPEEREDIIPRARTSINNISGLKNTLKRFAIPTDDTVPFALHQSVTSSELTASAVGEDLMDDIKREVAFYAQSLDAAKRARALLKAEGVPFSRPTDYFAEMVKDDGHMEKIKAKLIEDASAKKASAEARKLRDLKKFGKQVQVAKLQERQKAKRDTLEKIKTLKRKRSETSGGDLGTHEADLFDVGVDTELKGYKGNQRSQQRGGDRRAGGPNAKRQKKNEKYGFGGKKRHAKSGDAESSADLSGFSAKRMKSGAKGRVPKTARLGKNRRKATAGKR